MALPISSSDLISPLLLVKALLAVLSFFIFLYYRHYWNAAKKKLPVHFFFTKWRAVRHAYFLGYAALGFSIGFSIELFSPALGMSPDAARIASSVFEAGSLFSTLYVFFSLALEDVPHFQRIADASAQTVAPHNAPPPPERKMHGAPALPSASKSRAAPAKPKKMNAKKKRRKK